MAEVTLERVQKRIGSVEIIADLTLEVRDGEFFTLLGPSGCGKSTLLHLIAGLDRPTSGRILFDEQDVSGLPPRDRDVAMVFQSYALYPHMTVAENLAFPLRVGRRRSGLDRRAIDAEVRRVAALLSLEPLLDRRPRQLSGGQRQRVALGRALIRKPRVFLLDEPLSNLDVQLRADMRAELRRLHDELRITMIYVTHDQVEAMTLADRIAVLDRGRLQQIDTPRGLYEAPRNLFVAGFVGHPAMNTWKAVVHRREAVAGPLRVALHRDGEYGYDGRTVCVGIRPEDVRVVSESGKADAVGTVRLIEPTGGLTWVTCDVAMDGSDGDGSHRVLTLVGIAPRDFDATPGRFVGLRLERGAAHFFDPNTGVRLPGMSPSTLIEEAS